MSIECTEIEALHGLSYKLGLVHEAAGRGDAGDETRLAFDTMQE